MVRSLGLPAALLALAAGTAQAQPMVEAAWNLLTTAQQEKSADKRANAIRPLGLVRVQPRARTMAEAALADEHETVRAAAAEALGQMGDRQAIPKLKAALNDKEPVVVLAAAAALYELKDPTAYDVFYALLTGEQKSGNSLMESQVKLLHDPKALAKIGVEAGISFVPFGGLGYRVFRMATEDKASPIRAGAASKLAHDPDPNSAKALATAVADSKWIVRTAAIEAIVQRRGRPRLSVIEKAMEDENDIVRYTAAAAVIQLSRRPK